MHPEILRQITAQRGQEMRTQAHRSRLARMAIRGRRHGRALGADDLVIPAIPDYVDGTFRTGPATARPAAEQVSGETAAARRAA